MRVVKYEGGGGFSCVLALEGIGLLISSGWLCFWLHFVRGRCLYVLFFSLLIVFIFLYFEYLSCPRLLISEYKYMFFSVFRRYFVFLFSCFLTPSLLFYLLMLLFFSWITFALFFLIVLQVFIDFCLVFISYFFCPCRNDNGSNGISSFKCEKYKSNEDHVITMKMKKGNSDIIHKDDNEERLRKSLSSSKQCLIARL